MTGFPGISLREARAARSARNSVRIGDPKDSACALSVQEAEYRRARQGWSFLTDDYRCERKP
jgi:hypothetical protein